MTTWDGLTPPYSTIVADPISDLAAGMAGEHLVMVDLLMQGYRAIMAEQHCPYDVVVDLAGRLVRIQVKAARAPRSEALNQRQPAYVWNVRRSGKRGQRRYQDEDFDLLACVALDLRLVAFVPITTVMQHLQVRVPGWQPPERDARGRRWPAKGGREFDDLTFDKAVADL